MRLGGLGLRRNLAVVLLCTILASQPWEGTQASEVNSLITWRRPKDLTDDFLAGNTKPIMMLIHKSWCGACTNLRREIDDPYKAKEVVELSNEFVMVNAADADEPHDGVYSPDGKYIPRIIFLSPDGQVLPEFKCKLRMNPAYQYFYSTASQVAFTMKHVWHDLVNNQSTTADSSRISLPGVEDQLKVDEALEANTQNVI